MEPIGKIPEGNKYRMKPSESMPNTTLQRLRKRPPVVIPEEMPGTTMRRIFKASDLRESEDYESIKKHLNQYKKQGDNGRWEEYRFKIPPDLLETWRILLIECKRNGFANPHMRRGEIVFDQLISPGKNVDTDACTLCERDCRIRENIDAGECKRLKLIDNSYREPKKCWQSENGEVPF